MPKCRWCKYERTGRERCLNPECPGPKSAAKNTKQERNKRAYLIKVK